MTMMKLRLEGNLQPVSVWNTAMKKAFTCRVGMETATVKKTQRATLVRHILVCKGTLTGCTLTLIPMLSRKFSLATKTSTTVRILTLKAWRMELNAKYSLLQFLRFEHTIQVLSAMNLT